MFHEQKVPAVIASRMPLSCEGSIILAETLYKELLRESGNLRTALSAVRKALKMDTKSRDWMSLQFYAHAGDQAALCPFEKSSTAPATDKAVRELVLIRHEAYKRVTTEDPDPSSVPAIFGGRQPRRVEIDQTPLLKGRQWKNLEAEVRRLASPEGELQRVFAERGTDVGALAEGFVSVTPLQLDLTAYHTFTGLNTWQWNAAPYETTLLDVSQDMSLSQ